jgi:hypothetical protein
MTPLGDGREAALLRALPKRAELFYNLFKIPSMLPGRQRELRVDLSLTLIPLNRFDRQVQLFR